MIDVDARWIDDHRLGGEQLDLKAVGDRHRLYGLIRRFLG
jgi:hypothetical protein